MDLYKHHKRVWRLLYFVLKPLIRHKFNPDFEEIKTDDPIILICNHCTTWDPLLIAMALKHKQVYFVASEHIFWLGLISKVITWRVGPIARRKGAAANDTKDKCLEHFKAGHSICIFGEGEQSWDGLSRKVIRGTGKLVKDSGVTLVTYRMTGGFLSLPRWADKIRKGSIKGEVAGIYTPEDLKEKSPEEINEIMNRDIFVDIWKYQKEHMISFKSPYMAEHLERMLYLCPRCLSSSSLRSSGNIVSCECGLSITVNDYGFFEKNGYFETLAEWEKWQKENIRKHNFKKADEEDLFCEKISSL
ncbi:MAG: 1-acyl-sn-glycerol-3-phosphate acyltransferase [Erysipelotrichaceae bacterium]|nr:1-acyl-sn-glycerol-3-phosphate acyltransferase [Erysipelotrichaceae bacterium]